MSQGYEERKSGYENGAYAESAPSGSSEKPYRNEGHGGADRTGKREWNNPYASKPKGQFGRPRGFDSFADRRKREAERDFSLEPAELYKPYVGTGEEELPEAALVELREVRDLLQANGYTVRTSGFKGTDALFRESSRKELILPWKDFADLDSKLSFTTEEAKQLAKKHQGNYDNLPDVVKTFLGKDVRLVAGHNLRSPALFVVLYTPDGTEDYRKRQGFMRRCGHVVAIATDLRIPVFNFGRPDAKTRLLSYLQLKQPIQSTP